MIHPAQEADTIPGRKITAVGIGVIVVIVACALTAYGIGSCRTAAVHGVSESAKGPPIPADVYGMETRVFAVEAQGIEMNTRAEQLLTTYSWVDRDRGVIRVPITVAYQLLLERQSGGGR